VPAIPGTFTYTPPAGTVLAAGTNQQLRVDFTPADTTTYTGASKTVVINVLSARVPTTTSAPVSSAGTTSYGTAVTFTATVSAAGGTPAGTMSFFDNGAPLVTATLAAGIASVTTAALGAGMHAITATYNGSAQFAASTSAPFAQTVRQATGTTAVAVTLFTVQYSDVQTLTATFTPSKSGGPAPARVSFRIGTQPIGEAPVTLSGGVYKAVWSGPLLEPVNPAPATAQLRPGVKTVYATTNDPNFVASTGSRPFTLSKEDALITRTMPASVKLRADGTIILTTRVSEAPENPATPGSLTNATVAFIDRATGATIATVPAAADGTAAYNWTPAMGTATSKTFTIGFLVSGYYNRNATVDNMTLVVQK
jgi:hypothetical protein